MITCPVACEYCMASKIDIRSKYWNKGERIGINKTCTFINRLPQNPPLSEFFPVDIKLLEAEYVGFQGITDCFWNIYIDDFKYLVKTLQHVRKFVFTSKIPFSEEHFCVLKNLGKRVVVIYSVTGLDMLEKTTTLERIMAISKLKENDIDVLPIVHPYIPDLADLSFFKDLKACGITEISWKGFRYNPNTMKALEQYVCQENLLKYKNNEKEVLLCEGIIQETAYANGLNFVRMRDFVQRPNGTDGITEDKAEKFVSKLMEKAVISSSEEDINEIKRIAIRRRL